MNNTNTLEVIENFGNKIDSYIQIAAEKGNQTVEHFWPIIVRQQGIEAWTFIIGVSLITLICTILLIEGVKNFEGKDGDVSVNGIFGLVGGFGLIVCLIVLIENLAVNEINVVTKLLNPEYAALQEVIKMIK